MKPALKSILLVGNLLIAGHAFAQATGTPSSATEAPAKTPAAKSKPFQTPDTAAPGGGNGKVWANAGSKVYHCQGSRFYGKTKSGSYITEAEAKAGGMHAVNKKGCS